MQVAQKGESWCQQDSEEQRLCHLAGVGLLLKPMSKNRCQFVYTIPNHLPHDINAFKGSFFHCQQRYQAVVENKAMMVKPVKKIMK